MEDDGDTDFEGNPADRKYYIHFNSAPVEVLGEDGKVKAIRVEKTTTSADGKMTRTGEFEESTRCRPCITQSATSRPPRRASRTTSVARTWPTRTATAASPRRPPARARRCVSVCTPPVGPSVVRSA